MGQIGCLGDIVFEVSSKTVRTIDNIHWSGTAVYATHQRHGTNALTEFVSVDPDKMTFDIRLSADLGVDPMTELSKIWTYQRSGAALPLVIGDKAYGKYRWSILSNEIQLQTFDRRGNVLSATVSLSLQEYLRE